MKIEIRMPSAEERTQASAWPIWACQPCSFEWGYADTETSMILEGEALVEARGKEYSIGPGDWVVFPKGLACRWRVKKALKKHYRFG
jgi:uncharacterized cupin superfamily protein